MAQSQSHAARSPYRRRRVIWSILLFTFGLLFYLGTHPNSAFGLGSWSLPSYLKDTGLSSSSSRARVIADAKAHDVLEAGRLRVQEIHGLLHLVTEYPERRLDDGGGEMVAQGSGSTRVNGSEPVDLRVYSPDGDDWQTYVKTLREQYPVIVFSKSYCPYVHTILLLNALDETLIQILETGQKPAGIVQALSSAVCCGA